MDVSGSGELGVSSSEEGKLWVWETDTSESRVCMCVHISITCYPVHACGSRYYVIGTGVHLYIYMYIYVYMYI